MEQYPDIVFGYGFNNEYRYVSEINIRLSQQTLMKPDSEGWNVIIHLDNYSLANDHYLLASIADIHSYSVYHCSFVFHEKTELYQRQERWLSALCMYIVFVI